MVLPNNTDLIQNEPKILKFWYFRFGPLQTTTLQRPDLWSDEDLGSSEIPNSLDYAKVRKYYGCDRRHDFDRITMSGAKLHQILLKLIMDYGADHTLTDDFGRTASYYLKMSEEFHAASFEL